MRTSETPAHPITSSPHVGAVVIGRNEGQRLLRCLDSLRGQVSLLVYVDSGSTDGSVEQARARGAEVVALDMRQPFTAARARNAGLARLRELAPRLALVQFVDGDCEIDPGWLAAGTALLAARPEAVAVFGRLHERHPEASIYNQLCDLEWNVPPGQVRSCGGNALMRVAALAAVNGFRDSLVAGEEPELCVRLRGAGGQIWCVAASMGKHDAAMTRFTQWWQRTRRSGFAFAQGAHLHGAPPERHFVAETRRAVAWGALLPLALAGLSALHPLAGLLWAVYPVQVARVARHLRQSRPAHPMPVRHAAFLILGRLPEALGVLTFVWRQLRRGPVRLIEYK